MSVNKKHFAHKLHKRHQPARNQNVNKDVITDLSPNFASYILEVHKKHTTFESLP